MPQNTADLVLGQRLFTTGGVGYTTGGSLNMNSGVAYAGMIAVDETNNRVYAVDSANNRVLFWNGMTTLTSGKDADGVLGQQDLFSNAAAAGASGLTHPGSVSVDSSGNVWISDTGNNRVLRFPPPISTGMSADVVIGQQSFFGTAAATTVDTLNKPTDARIDSTGQLWVADSGNNRVVRYTGLFVTGQSAELVIGQQTYIDKAPGTTPTTLNFPTGLAFDSKGDVVVSDTGNNRVVLYRSPQTLGMGATAALGQASLFTGGAGTTVNTLNFPGGITFDKNDSLWVADFKNNRVLRYDKPLSTGRDASLVLGQGAMNTGGANTTATGLNAPAGVAVLSTGEVGVADIFNNRLLHYDAGVKSGNPAGLVLGQHDFTHSGTLIDGRQLRAPGGVLVDVARNRAFVADSANNRVLFWNSLSSLANGRAADGALGQPDLFTVAAAAVGDTSLNDPRALALDSAGNLWVADNGNARAVRFSAPFATGMAADTAVGQADLFTACATAPSATCASAALGVAVDGAGNLWVTDTNRVLRFPTPLTTGMSADLALGQGGLGANGAGTSDTQLSDPRQIAFDTAGNLWVADNGNNRAVRFPAPLAMGMSADVGLGQANLFAAVAGAGAAGLSGPRGVAVDASGHVYVCDFNNNRVVRYDGPLATAMNASAVVGQASLATSAAATTASGLSGPSGISVDASGNLWAADLTNNRVLQFRGASSALIGSTGGILTYVTPRGTATVTVPAGALSSQVTLSVSVPSAVPAANSPTTTLLASNVALTLSADAPVRPTLPISVTIPYADADVAALNPSAMIVAAYAPASNVWVPTPSTVNTLQHTVTAHVLSFSTYQLMQAQAAGSVSEGVVFPNPFRPAMGHLAVTFSNFPPGATLRLYTILGEKVRELTTDAVGMATWDGVSGFGRGVSSGVYYVLVDGDRQHKVYKLAVQR